MSNQQQASIRPADALATGPSLANYGAQTTAALSALTARQGALRLQLASAPMQIPAADWDALLACQAAPTPFMRHAYLQALHASASAVADSGWQAQFLALWQHGQLMAACPLYLKSHSYGEYVFDWAWARAYAEHGLDYYPKAVIGVPFTPVPGSRLLARSDAWRQALLQLAVAWADDNALSSLHLLLGDEADLANAATQGLMLRDGVQFHWQNRSQLQPDATDWHSFDDFLASLMQDKRKKIRAEQRKVTQAGVCFRWARGRDIAPQDWQFFYHCYERTYLEHGNAPYLTPEFFAAMAQAMPEHWLLFIAEQHGQPIACSLIGLQLDAAGQPQVAYGRYWGALRRIDCLHFDACYYQPLQWCIAHGVQRFEGGAQGEHKMARALLPSPTASAHWLAHPAFADAVQRFLDRESLGMQDYLQELALRSPLRKAGS